MKLRALPILLFFACNTAPDRVLDPTDDRFGWDQVTRLQPRYNVCFNAGRECGPDQQTACCDGLFCSTELLIYGPGACTAPQENGSFCAEDAHCASGRCLDGTCTDPSCREHGVECYDDHEACCPGLFCFQDLSSYGVALCGPPQPTGAFCVEDGWCASGSCADSACL